MKSKKSNGIINREIYYNRMYERKVLLAMKKINNAEIICVGTELLLGDIINTNAAYLSKQLASIGISIYHQSVVGDNPERLLNELDAASKRCDLIITSGGLGPTYDDLTKETISSFFGRRLVMNNELLDGIKEYFASTHREMTENNAKQAMMPEGSIIIKNNYGTACGVIIEDEPTNTTLIMLPGPPRELEPMFSEEVIPYLRSRSDTVIVSQNIHIFGMGESMVESHLKELMEKSKNPTVAPYCIAGEVRLRVTAKAEDEDKAHEMCNEMIEHIKTTAVGKNIYGVDCDTLENALVTALKDAHLTISCAESCTGGLITKRITDISGASEVLIGSAVTYANDAKIKLLGVNPETIKKHGAVSEQTAIEMANGIRTALGSDIGISSTGIAGPTGGSAEKPVGTVYIGISTTKRTFAVNLGLSSKRERAYIRTLSASNAFSLALEEIKNLI